MQSLIDPELLEMVNSNDDLFDSISPQKTKSHSVDNTKSLASLQIVPPVSHISPMPRRYTLRARNSNVALESSKPSLFSWYPPGHRRILSEIDSSRKQDETNQVTNNNTRRRNRAKSESEGGKSKAAKTATKRKNDEDKENNVQPKSSSQNNKRIKTFEKQVIMKF